MIHFDLIFVYFWGEEHVDVQLFHHHLLQRWFSLNFLCTFVRYQMPIYVPSISGFSILFLLSISVFMLILTCVDYYDFIVDIKRGSSSCPKLFFFFKFSFLFLVLHICIWILDSDCQSLQNSLLELLVGLFGICRPILRELTS